MTSRQTASMTTPRHDHELSLEEIVTLGDTSETERVSLYLPTHPAGREADQDPIRFRNLLRLARAELGDAGLSAPAERLASDPTFWAHGTAGLGVLIDSGGLTAVRLADPVEELVVVSDRFHLKPLLAAAHRARECHVLALSRHAVRLLHATRGTVDEVAVPELPAGIDDALRWDDRERQLQSHATGRVGSGSATAAYHGQGGGNEQHESDLRRYVQVIDRAVSAHLGDARVPLVLAGVDELVAVYRASTHHRHVVAGAIGGNPDHVEDRDLAARAMELLEPAVDTAEERARDRFLSARHATVGTVEQAVVAAEAGQVESLFVPHDAACWGRFRPGHTALTEHDERRPGDHDLADVAAVETLRHGGEVFLVRAADVPGEGTAAATLRY
jgi:hypothetical protein